MDICVCVKRDAVVRGFRSGNVWVLICTDVMCRGMDFKGVNLVVNYDFPNSDYVYIHRIGHYLLAYVTVLAAHFICWSPRLAQESVNFLSLTLSVCPPVCLSQTLLVLFCFSMESSHFLAISSP